jgi:probable rRNA maturation factor
MIEIINRVPGFRKTGLLKKLAGFAGKMLSDFGKNRYDMNIVFCNDTFIHSLNRDYRGKDAPTDVLSFSQLEGDEDSFDCPGKTSKERKQLGDIIISMDTAKRQAKEFKVTLEEELARLVVHGVLHLLGFDHETSKADEKVMMKKQDAYLERFLKTVSR